MKRLRPGQQFGVVAGRNETQMVLRIRLGGAVFEVALDQQEVLDLAEYLETQAIELFSKAARSANRNVTGDS